MNIESANQLLREYTKSESLLKHSLAVAIAMGWYAEHLGKSQEEQNLWYITGLLHDFDYEAYPSPFSESGSPLGHPFWGVQKLKELGYPEIMCEAILGHADYTKVPRTSELAKYLFACDELSGLVTASAYVRPDKSLLSLELKSLQKRFKEKQFSKGCNRDDIALGAKEIGLELAQHMQNILTALKSKARELGLEGLPQSQAINSTLNANP